MWLSTIIRDYDIKCMSGVDREMAEASIKRSNIVILILYNLQKKCNFNKSIYNVAFKACINQANIGDVPIHMKRRADGPPFLYLKILLDTSGNVVNRHKYRSKKCSHTETEKYNHRWLNEPNKRIY